MYIQLFSKVMSLLSLNQNEYPEPPTKVQFFEAQRREFEDFYRGAILMVTWTSEHMPFLLRHPTPRVSFWDLPLPLPLIFPLSSV